MKISVVVPVRDEASSIRELLDNLLSQTRKPDEIVITDGGSVDSTRQIIADYIQSGAPVRLIEAEVALPGRGRNLAAAAAKFEWIAFIDAGIRPATNWLEALASRAQAEKSTDVVYGSWEPVIDTFFKECAAIAYLPPAQPTNGSSLRPRSIASSLMRRDVWQAVGGFPEDLRSGEDLVFMNRVESKGFQIVSEPLAVVFWNIKPSFATTFRRFVCYSRNNIRAGLWRQWQAAILSRYSILLLLAFVLLILDRRWLWLPVLLWLLMLLARGVVAIWRNRFCHPAGSGRNLRRLAVLTPLIAVLDAAAIIGSIEWLLMDSFRFRAKTAVEARNGA